MYLSLLVCLGLFAIGDILGVLTKAKLSSVFVALMLFMVGFLTGVFPPDIIQRAGLHTIAKFSSAFIVFHMGTMINMKELIDEWRTVVVSIIAMIVAVASICLVIPFIGKEAAIVSIPIVNGGLVATQIMTEAALAKGASMAAALGAFVYAIQKFVGTPPASYCGMKEAEAILKVYREGKLEGAAETEKTAKTIGGPGKVPLYKQYEKYYTDFVCLGITALFAYIASLLGEYTPLVTSIWSLILGTVVGYLGLVPPRILSVGKASGFFTATTFASVIPSLAQITWADLSTLGFQTFIVFAATMIGIFIFMYLLPIWKIVGSRNLSVGISMAQLLGFPATFLIANEIATAVAENEQEKEIVLKKIMPAYVVAGFASVTSISVIIAGIFVKFL